MKCKKCKKTVEKGSKFKDFCSEECKKIYTETYKQMVVKKKKRKKTTPKTIPLSGEALKALCEPYGGLKWYEMAKKYCCNFDVRSREGNCITLAEPYFIFSIPCSECTLGIALIEKYVTKEDE
jgi:hypothetical protein